MNYELFKKLHNKAIECENEEAFVAECVQQGFEKSHEDATLIKIFDLANSDIKTNREKHGYSRLEFAEVYGIPFRTLQNWDYGTNSPQDYVKMMIDYTLFNKE